MLTHFRVLTPEEREQAPVLTVYEKDPYSWALQQAELLRSGQLSLIDAFNLAEEITALARYIERKLRSDLSRVLQHLLKWDYQSDRRTRSWVLSIEEHRRCVDEHLQDSPGLRSRLFELTQRAYADGRSYALQETRLREGTLPENCPYGWDEIMTRPIEWPETA